MRATIFLSYPRPFLKEQQQFIDRLTEYLKQHNFDPKTLGVTDYDMDAPLKAIRRLMIESNGVLTVAFKRSNVIKGVKNPQSDMPGVNENQIDNQWITSPYCQIEPAMGFQLGLPILIFREKGVIEEGVLEKGVLGLQVPEFDLTNSLSEYFESREFHDVLVRWEGYVRAVSERKGNPPKMY